MENSLHCDETRENIQGTREERFVAICQAWQKANRLSLIILINMDTSFKATMAMLWMSGRMNGNNAAIEGMAVSTGLTVFTYLFRKKILNLFARSYVQASKIIPLSREMVQHDEQRHIEEILTKFPAILPALNQVAE